MSTPLVIADSSISGYIASMIIAVSADRLFFVGLRIGIVSSANFQYRADQHERYEQDGPGCVWDEDDVCIKLRHIAHPEGEFALYQA